jgi:CRP-like cAMP-binding protein
MAKIIDVDCSLCLKKDEGCCKACFNGRDISVFESLTNEELEHLMEKKQMIHYDSGEVIVRQNTPSTFAICIKSGLAKVSVAGLDNKMIIVKLANHLDLLTGGDLFNGNIQPFTITAITDVDCCLIHSTKLVKLFSENSIFSVELMRHHSRQNAYLLSKLVNQTQKYMPGRVADTLLYLKDEIYQSNTFSIPLTRQELADMSNMTKESFVRILQEFKSSEIIKTKGNSFEIIDHNHLLSISKNG